MATAAVANGRVTKEELVAKCLSIGLVMRRAPQFDVTHPPVTLQPTLVTERSLSFVTSLQPQWNRLIDTVARDYQFLIGALQSCATSDAEFTGRLLRMLSEVYLNTDGSRRRDVQHAMLGIFRTDYMRHEPTANTQEWKNVEINTISCSFAGLGAKVPLLHKYLQAAVRAEEDDQDATDGAAQKERREWLAGATVYRGQSDSVVPAALFAAHSHVLRTTPTDALRNWKPVVVFVVQENERNTGDQFLLSCQLLDEHAVRSIRRTMTELHQSMRLITASAANGTAVPPPIAVIGERYVATVFYFRCSYVPQDFKDEGCWTARRDMERSCAVKCPSIPYHLAGFKKIQQLLSVPEVLSKFVTDAESRQALQSTFMGQYSLDSGEVGSAVANERISRAIANPSQYVLKPQLEGGGNLLAGSKLVSALQRPSDDPAHLRLRREYILMERIVSPRTSGSILRFGEILTFEQNLCCELGIFGTILSTTSGDDSASSEQTTQRPTDITVLHNEFAGTLVRTKPADVDDGGVMAGVAALDSLAIVPE